MVGTSPPSRRGHRELVSWMPYGQVFRRICVAPSRGRPVEDGVALKTVTIVHGQLSHGGSERQLYDLLLHCDRSAFEPHLILSGELGYWHQPIAELDVPVTLLTGSPLRKLWSFRRLMRSHGADVFLSWSAYTNVFAFAAMGLPAKRVGSFRNVKHEDSKYFKHVWRLAKLHGLQSIICNSRETRESLLRDARSSQKVVYVPNGTEPVHDVELHRTIWRDKLGIGPYEKLVVGVGRLAPQKNFRRFVDVVVEASRSQPCKAVIAGPDLGLRPVLEDQIERSGLPEGTITLIGEVNDARELVCAADAYLLTSDHEGMPNVVMEAMAAGVPCVSTPVNGISELMDNRVHGMIGGWDVDSLAEPLVELLVDADLHRLVATNARERVATQFTPAIAAAAIWGEL